MKLPNYRLEAMQKMFRKKGWGNGKRYRYNLSEETGLPFCPICCEDLEQVPGGGAGTCKPCWKGYIYEGVPGEYTSMMEYPFAMTRHYSFSSKKAEKDPFWKEGVEEMRALSEKEGMTDEEKEAFSGLTEKVDGV